jgi:hypothetical protein
MKSVVLCPPKQSFIKSGVFWCRMKFYRNKWWFTVLKENLQVVNRISWYWRKVIENFHFILASIIQHRVLYQWTILISVNSFNQQNLQLNYINDIGYFSQNEKIPYRWNLHKATPILKLISWIVNTYLLL